MLHIYVLYTCITIIGRLLFGNSIAPVIHPAKAADYAFLGDISKPIHAVFWATAKAQGLEEHFDSIPGQLFCVILHLACTN